MDEFPSFRFHSPRSRDSREVLNILRASNDYYTQLMHNMNMELPVRFNITRAPGLSTFWYYGSQSVRI